MANLQETATWENGIRQLEVTDPVIGGPDGIDNIAPRQLANRTLFLKGQVDSLRAGLNQTNNNVTNLDSSKESKTVVSALASRVSSVESGKEDKTTVAALAARLAVVERKAAVFAAGGGMVLWNKPANQIPPGWAEVVDWRGRMPIGLDSSQTEFNEIGKTGGSKTVTLSASQLPVINGSFETLASTGGTGSGAFSYSSSVQAQISGNFSTFSHKSVSFQIGGNQAHDNMSPYRVVMFIEYVG